MIMKNFPWLAVFAAPLALSAQTKPIVSADVVFQETDGLVAIEAEHFTKQERTEVRAWYIHSTQHAVWLDAQSASFAAAASIRLFSRPSIGEQYRRSPQHLPKSLVLGTGLEPALLAQTASKTVVSAIPPPER
jgi:hypothetical protein